MDSNQQTQSTQSEASARPIIQSSTEQVPTQKPVSKTPSSGGKSILILLIAILLLIVGLGGIYYLGLNKSKSIVQKQSEAITPTSTQSILTPTLSPDQAQKNQDVVQFEDPKFKYKLQYPASWKPSQKEVAPFAAVFESPDYYNSGRDSAMKGTRILIHEENTNETDIDIKFSKDPLGPEIARNKIKTVVDGQKAIQYDYSYEGVNATNTIFIKNGISYLIKIEYANEAGKEAFWSIYNNLLTSFKAT